MIVDFHSHTSESDGTLTPAELRAAMLARGVSRYAITDHDNLTAYEQLETGTGSPRLVTGVEINTTYRGNEVHILGYGFRLGETELERTVEENRVARERRAEAMIDQLARVGYEISMEAVRAEAGPRAALGRPHVAKALVRAGFVSDVDAAFRNVLSAGRPGYVPSSHITPQRAVAAVVRSGGAAVLAHPGRLRDERLIDDLVDAGIVGLEAFYPTHQPAQVAYFRARAQQLGLVMTAGSDFHHARWNSRGVGVDVAEEDIRPFLELIGEI